jgi:Protein of unknown function (DUF2510)
MRSDGAAGSVTIWEGGRRALCADDLGVRVPGVRGRRLAWSEIGRFEDGSALDREGFYSWVLLVVLHTGEQVSACEASLPAPAMLTAIREMAQKHGIPAQVTGLAMKDGGPADPLETVRIGSDVRADRLAVTSAAGRFEWAEISGFGDGGGTSEDGDYWELLIRLTSGRTVSARCVPTPEALAAIRQLAARHQMPADISGIPMRGARPVTAGLYQDPGGEHGLRYWDGTQWSPLLPPEVGNSKIVRDSAASWRELPMADGPWTHAAVRGRRSGTRCAVFLVLSVALLAAGLAGELWPDGGTPHKYASNPAWYLLATSLALLASQARRSRRFFRKLDQAARTSIGGW